MARREDVSASRRSAWHAGDQLRAAAARKGSLEPRRCGEATPDNEYRILAPLYPTLSGTAGYVGIQVLQRLVADFGFIRRHGRMTRVSARLVGRQDYARTMGISCRRSPA